MRKLIIFLNLILLQSYNAQNNCNISSCSFVNNGDFENATIFGQFTSIPCWSELSSSPDIYNINTNPPIPSHESSLTNNNFIMLYANSSSGTYDSESVQTLLNQPLVQNQDYVLSFWVWLENPTNLPNLTIPPLIFSIMDDNVFIPNTVIADYYTFESQFPRAIQIASQEPSSFGEWIYYCIPFTTPINMKDQNLLTVHIGDVQTQSSGATFFYIDDISIQNSNPCLDLTLPDICFNETINNLNNFLSPTQTGGTFWGNGVVGNTFNASVAGTGTHTISYEIINSQGCTTHAQSTITVLDQNNPTCPCQNNLTLIVPDLQSLYQRHEWIIAQDSYSVSNSQEVILKAGDYIELLPNTYYQTTEFFEAFIEDCCPTCKIVE